MAAEPPLASAAVAEQSGPTLVNARHRSRDRVEPLSHSRLGARSRLASLHHLHFVRQSSCCVVQLALQLSSVHLALQLTVVSSQVLVQVTVVVVVVVVLPLPASGAALPAAPLLFSSQLLTQLSCVVVQEPLQPSSVHLPTHVVLVSSQLLAHVSTLLRPVWLTVGSSTFVVHAVDPQMRAKRIDGTTLILVINFSPEDAKRAAPALQRNTNANAFTARRR